MENITVEHTHGLGLYETYVHHSSFVERSWIVLVFDTRENSLILVKYIYSHIKAWLF